jgi:dolichyl-phosphate-mannose-protein mannosyltransferase
MEQNQLTPTHAREDVRALFLVTCFVAAALFLFLWGITRIKTFGLDEEPYVNSARFLVYGTSHWTPDHPPLGKSLIAAGIKFAGDNPLGWRIASAVSGSLTLAAIMLLTYLLLGSIEYTVIAGLLTLFDNFLFVMSRTAMLDAFLVLFLLWGYLFFLAAVATNYPRRTRSVCLMLSGILLGLATACKWNGLFSIGALVVIGCIVYMRRRNFNLRLLLVSFSLLPALAYSTTFICLFRYSGTPFTLSNLFTIQGRMYRFMAALPGNGFIHVPWFVWPFEIAPQRGLMYLVGNYAVMFSGLLALGVCGWRVARRFAVPELTAASATNGALELTPELTIVGLYLVNLMQWVVIPHKIVCYYYYYPCALLLSLALVLAFHRSERKQLFGIRLSIVPVVAAIAIFLFSYSHMASLEAPWDTVLGYWR